MTNIEELIKHPIQLKSVDLIFCNLNKNTKFKEDNLKEKVSLNLKTWGEVDIAGWDGECGEFYEMKVGPKNFHETVLKLLSYIKTELDKKKVNNIVVCITMVNKNKLETQIESVRKNYGLRIFGKQELLSLANR
ncbi:MAG: hypothetical protein ACI33J_05555 [Clostridium sp.]